MKIILAMTGDARHYAIKFDTSGSLPTRVATAQAAIRSHAFGTASFDAVFEAIDAYDGPAVPLLGTVNIDRAEFWISSFNDDTQRDDESETVNNSDLVQGAALGLDVLVLSGPHEDLESFMDANRAFAPDFFGSSGGALKVGLRSFYDAEIQVLDADTVVVALNEKAAVREGR